MRRPAHKGRRERACGLAKARRVGGLSAGLTARGLWCEPNRRRAGSSAGWLHGLAPGLAQGSWHKKRLRKRLMEFVRCELAPRDHANRSPAPQHVPQPYF